jgi:hypothetical protein
MMSTDPSPSQSKPAKYEIHIRGHISPRWANWFGNLTIVDNEGFGQSGLSRINIEVADQAAMLGLLQKMHNLGHSILEIRRIGESKTDRRSIK